MSAPDPVLAAWSDLAAAKAEFRAIYAGHWRPNPISFKEFRHRFPEWLDCLVGFVRPI